MAKFQDHNDYEELYELDAHDEWMNGAYDENGDSVVCDICGGEMKWSPRDCEWYCPDCGQRMSRPVYFNHIGAQPPERECLTNCCENYPFCKNTCERCFIDPDDPMLI